MKNSASAPVTWWQCEPRRLARDQSEIRERFPDLEWRPDGAGEWRGLLPRWPFTRPEPQGLAEMIGLRGLKVAVLYGHAYPMVPPAIHPLDPEPDLLMRTDQRWHVMGDGRLCLFQDDATWTGRDSVVELLLKAAGWRVEFELMQRGAIERMTVNGIVDDPQLDHLLARAAVQEPVTSDNSTSGTGQLLS
ncbi:hypothetical protein AB0M95_31705 [Sphaerisporangium sp. NPDC051017]|uniref:hypothetical protein n=1 Tax=Sphaerisporangium sp. NPDC051017 TaxID=3154636 RepID=UPI00342C8EB4